jgi:hypothetical protein
MITGADTPDAGGACDTQVQTAADGDYDAATPAGGVGYEYLATEFTAAKTTTICNIEIYIEKNNAPTGNFQVCIYSDDGEPNVPIDCSDNYDASTVPADGSPAWFSVTTGLSAAIENTTTYNVVMVFNDDNTNNIHWWRGDAAVEQIWRDVDGLGTWTSVTASKSQTFKLYE